MALGPIGRWVVMPHTEHPVLDEQRLHDGICHLPGRTGAPSRPELHSQVLWRPVHQREVCFVPEPPTGLLDHLRDLLDRVGAVHVAGLCPGGRAILEGPQARAEDLAAQLLRPEGASLAQAKALRELGHARGTALGHARSKDLEGHLPAQGNLQPSRCSDVVDVVICHLGEQRFPPRLLRLARIVCCAAFIQANIVVARDEYLQLPWLDCDKPIKEHVELFKIGVFTHNRVRDEG
mmetsp:Transcript_105630/g.251864  ORF Transcript_105630/g.251864 Transcript_105630/m.251864 type:complete len:235 (+) Transcript_105630:366-1070(+)